MKNRVHRQKVEVLKHEKPVYFFIPICLSQCSLYHFYQEPNLDMNSKKIYDKK